MGILRFYEVNLFQYVTVNYDKRSFFFCDGTILVSRGMDERKERALSIFALKLYENQNGLIQFPCGVQTCLDQFFLIVYCFQLFKGITSVLCRIFSPEAACEVIEAERHSHVFHQAEPDIWMVMVRYLFPNNNLTDELRYWFFDV